MTQHNWAAIYEQALEIAPAYESWTRLARQMGISRRTLQDGLRREHGIGTFDDLIAHCELSLDVDVSLQKYQLQAKHYQAQVRSLRRQLSYREWLEDIIREVAAVLPPAPKIQHPVKTTGNSESAVLLVGDIHWGQKTPKAQVGVLPEYNSAIAQARTVQTFETFLSITGKHRTFTNIETAYILLMGDEAEGSHLRPQQGKFVDRNIVQQTLEFGQCAAQGIRAVAAEFKEVRVIGVPGNHTRVLPKPGDNEPSETFDYMSYRYIEALLAQQDNITYDFPETWYSLFDIYGWKFFMAHGEDIRSWAGFPWYGITRFMRDYQAMMHLITRNNIRNEKPETLEDLMPLLMEFDYCLLAHFHQSAMWDDVDVEVMVNGTMAGVSLYGAKRVHKLSRPRQQMFFVHPEHGVTGRYPIYLDRG